MGGVAFERGDLLSPGLSGVRKSTTYFASEKEGGPDAERSDREGETKREECAGEENVREENVEGSVGQEEHG